MSERNPSVLWNQSQSLTEAEKAQARENIGAGVGGGGKTRHDASFVRTNPGESDPAYEVQNVKNYCINHVAIDGHAGDICNVLVKAPILTGNEEYDYVVVFDCTNSSGSSYVDVENCSPEILNDAYELSKSYMNVKVAEANSASEADPPEARVVTDVNGSTVTKKYMRIEQASYSSVNPQTKAGPLLMIDANIVPATRTSHYIGFSGSPTYQIRVLGGCWSIHFF